MSTSGLDISQLSDSERSALETYTAVTGQEHLEAIPLLRRSQWNVQVSPNDDILPLDALGTKHLLPPDCHLQVL